MRLAENTGCKNREKFAICAPSRNFVGLYLCNQGMYRQSEKNLLNSNTCFICPRNMANFGSLAAEIGSLVWGTPANLTGFASWLRYCSNIAQRKPTKLCTMFGRLLDW